MPPLEAVALPTAPPAADTDLYEWVRPPAGAWGGVGGEEFMGTGTAYDPSESPPTYTPPPE